MSFVQNLNLMQQLVVKLGGARRDRTDDLLRARQALSQLSYGPLTCLFRQLLCRLFARCVHLPVCKLPCSLTSLLVLDEKSCVISPSVNILIRTHFSVIKAVVRDA